MSTQLTCHLGTLAATREAGSRTPGGCAARTTRAVSREPRGCAASAPPKPRNAGVLKRSLALGAAALLLATVVYGETWLLAAPASSCVECAVSASVARALDSAVVD